MCKFFDEIWSCDVLHLNDFGPEISRSCRYGLVVIDKFSMFRLTCALKNKMIKEKRNLRKTFSINPKE